MITLLYKVNSLSEQDMYDMKPNYVEAEVPPRHVIAACGTAKKDGRGFTGMCNDLIAQNAKI